MSRLFLFLSLVVAAVLPAAAQEMLRVALHGDGEGEVAIATYVRALLEKANSRLGYRLEYLYCTGNPGPEAFEDGRIDVIDAVFRDKAIERGYDLLWQSPGSVSVRLLAPPVLARELRRTMPFRWKPLRAAWSGGLVGPADDFSGWNDRELSPVTLVGFPRLADAVKSVRTRECDLLLVASAGVIPGFDEVASLGEHPCFMAVSRKRAGLYRALRDEIRRIHLEEPAAVDAFRERAFGVRPSPRRVRVARYYEAGYSLRDANGVPFGANEDSVSAVARRCGWQLEWIDCDYDEALERLAKGELDAVPGVTLTEERTGRFLYPRVPTGIYRARLFARRDSDYRPGFYDGWIGAVIASGPGEQSLAALRARLAERDCGCEIRVYPSVLEATDAFYRGECQMLHAVASGALGGEKTLEELPPVADYLCFAMNRRDLMLETEEALVELNSGKDDLLGEIARRHFLAGGRLELSFTPAERLFVRRRAVAMTPVKVEISPLSDVFKGWDFEHRLAFGFVNALFGELSRRTGLRFECVEPAELSVVRRRFLNGESELWAHFGADSSGVPYRTQPIDDITLPQVMLCRRDTPMENPAEGRAEEVAWRDGSPDGSVQRLLKGALDALYCPALSAFGILAGHDLDAELEIRPCAGGRAPVSFPVAVSPAAAPELAEIVRKAVRSLTAEDLEALFSQALAETESRKRPRSNFDEIATSGVWGVVALLTLFLGLVCGRREPPMLAALALLLLFPAAAEAAAGKDVLKVAFIEREGFCEFESGGHRRGYCVDCAERLAAKLGCGIQWVDLRLAELSAAMENGAVDVAVAVSLDPSEFPREMQLAGPPMGFARMALYVPANAPYTSDDPRRLDGIVVGIQDASLFEGRVKDHLGAAGAGCTFRRYPTLVALEKAFRNGEVGAVLSESLDVFRSCRALFRLPPAPLHFAVRRGNTQLADRVSEAVNEMLAQHPELPYEMRSLYFYDPSLSETPFTPEEREWLARMHRLGKVFNVEIAPAIPYMKDFSRETGRPTGLLAVLLEEIGSRSGLEFRVSPPDTVAGSRRRLLSGDSDIWFSYGLRMGDLGLPDSVRTVAFQIPQLCCSRRFRDIDYRNTKLRFGVYDGDEERISAYSRFGVLDHARFEYTRPALLTSMLEGRTDLFIGTYPEVRRLVHAAGAESRVDMRLVNSVRYRPEFRIHFTDARGGLAASVIGKIVASFSQDQLVEFANRAEARDRKGILTVREALPYIVSGALLALLAIIVILFVSRHRVRAALREAKYAAQMKANFLATMSHEIRTPLNAVCGFSEFLVAPDVTPERIQECSRGISLSANALLSLINDILDLSKFESGSLEGLDFRSGSCVIRSVFAEMENIFKMKTKEKGITLAFSGADELPRLGVAEARVRQVLLNLIGNAVKFTDQGGVEVSAAYADEVFSLRVRDSGIGISELALAHIFDPFNQDMDSRRGRVYAGTGLGLAIVKRLVEASGGTITVESEVGAGSTFEVRLPGVAALGPAAASAAAVEKTGPAKIDKVMIVDDLSMNRQILSMYCRSLGVGRILCYETAAEVLDALKGGERPDVILTDLWMPEMNGAELAKQVRGEYPGIPVVAITADTDSGLRFDISAFRAILTKPLNSKKLKALFAELGGAV